MSDNTRDTRNGFKNSRIDLSQLGDDSWSKPARRNVALPGPRRKSGATTGAVPAAQRAHLDELFESRVRAAAARRTVKQTSGQNRVWMFAGGLFAASLGGVAAAYYLVGPPMATTAYSTDAVEYQAAQTSSLETGNDIAGTSSHFQGVPVLAAAPVSQADDIAAAPNDIAPSTGEQVDAVIEQREPVEPPAPAEVAATVTSSTADETPKPEPEQAAVKELPVPEDPEPSATPSVEERLVRVVPTSVSDEIKTRTNVNTSETTEAAGGSDGQWLAVPAEQEPVVTAAAEPAQPADIKPDSKPVKTQQELFKAFQAYLESSGHAKTGNDENQEALFDKFMRWSVEALKEN